MPSTLPGSTTINEVPLLDFAGNSPLLVPSGLTLGDVGVGVGVKVIARMRVIVNSPVPDSSVIEPRALVNWDDAPEMVVRGELLRVRSSPAPLIIDPLLPFSVLDARAGRPAPIGRRSTYDALSGDEEYTADEAESIRRRTYGVLSEEEKSSVDRPTGNRLTDDPFGRSRRP
jgi:hypothetical protein